MKEFIVLSIIFWLPPFFAILKNALWDLYFWQIKEFRWDRFWVHLRWDQEELNRSALATGIKFVCFAFVSLLFEHQLSAAIGVILAYLVWTNELFLFIQHALAGKLRKPAFKNPRNLIILSLFLISFLLVIAYVTLPFSIFEDRNEGVRYAYFSETLRRNIDNLDIIFPDTYLFLTVSTLVALFIDLASPFIITVLVVLTFPFARIRRKLIIKKAKAKLKNFKGNLVVVGITGSQGKTTTKEVLYHLLKNEYKTAKTPANHNTDVGVAMAILNDLKEDTQVFIVEIGALRNNEIQDICEIIPPDISIVTDVDVQHIGIFGSQEKLFEAKSEIVRFKKAEGSAVLNGDNQYCLRMAKLHNGENIIYTANSETYRKLVQEKNPETKVLFYKNNHPKNGISFTLESNNYKEEIDIEVSGDHLLNIFTACVATALELNLSFETIKKNLKNFDTRLPRLALDAGDNDTIILNDTYNSSYKGFVAAVNLMNKTKGGKRIVITKGIYELGRYKEETYKKLFKEVANKFDILITSDALLAKIAKNDNSKIDIYLLKNNVDIVYKLREILEPKDIILLEGRLHPSVIKEILSDEK